MGRETLEQESSVEFARCSVERVKVLRREYGVGFSSEVQHVKNILTGAKMTNELAFKRKKTKKSRTALEVHLFKVIIFY